MTTFYKDKGEVKLKPGQTLGFTAGKGYYAAGTPAPPKPSPAPARPSSKAEPTATRPTAANMPTTPPRHASAPTTARPAGAPDTDARKRSDARAGQSPASTRPKLTESTAFYTRASDVPLGPGQTLGYAGEKGYYAAGRPEPIKASTTPRPSTVKVTAVSTRASTESPLVEHVETRDGRTTIRLSHATKPAGVETSQQRKVSAHASERSAKPSQDATHATAVETKKASSRVHEQLAKNKERSHHPKSGIGRHPGHKHDPRATAASAGDADHSRRRDRHPSPFTTPFEFLPPGAPALRPGMHWEASTSFDTPDFAAETSLQASLTGVQVQEHNGDLVVSTAGGQTLLSLPLGPLNSNVVQSVAAVASQLKQGLTKTYYVAGVGTVTATWNTSGLSISTSTHGVTTTVAIKLPDEIEISTEGTVHAQTPLASKPLPVKLDVTTTLTFHPPTPPPRERFPKPAHEPKHVHEPAKKPFPSIYDLKPAPPVITLPLPAPVADFLGALGDALG